MLSQLAQINLHLTLASHSSFTFNSALFQVLLIVFLILKPSDLGQEGVKDKFFFFGLLFSLPIFFPFNFGSFVFLFKGINNYLPG